MPAKHPRFKLHVTPKNASWMDFVESFFAKITRQRIQCAAFASVAELEAAIGDYHLRHNADPNPFVWTRSAEVIERKDRRALEALEAIKVSQTSELER